VSFEHRSTGPVKFPLEGAVPGLVPYPHEVLAGAKAIRLALIDAIDHCFPGNERGASEETGNKMNVFPIENARSSIRWIAVTDRVPNDRRDVVAWGPIDWLFGTWKRKPKFLGITRFNKGKDGDRGQFGCELLGAHSIVVCEVTHWAEITGPAEPL